MHYFRSIVRFDLMTTWSIGCSIDVVFGGNNMMSIAERSLMTRGCDGQLSITRATFLSAVVKRRSNLRTHSTKISLSIQLFFWDLYTQGSCLMF